MKFQTYLLLYYRITRFRQAGRNDELFYIQSEDLNKNFQQDHKRFYNNFN